MTAEHAGARRAEHPGGQPVGGTVLVVRLDSDGDVLLSGPAVRALAATADAVDLLVSPAGEAAARLLPAVRDVLVFDAPWSGYRPPPVDPAATERLLEDLRARRYDRAVVLTSFHQSPLPAALLLRLAAVPFVAATSEDYPGSLLDVRHHRPDGAHEVEAALDLARAAGGHLPPDDTGALAVRRPLPDHRDLVAAERYVVLHPTASVPARSLTVEHAGAVVAALAAAGRHVVVTGAPADTGRVGAVVARACADAAAWSGHPGVTDLSGCTDLPRLAGVLAGADCVVAVNTGPAHLAAAVGTPVVSLFAPVVPADRWAPWCVPVELLGDQHAACAGSRARTCPVEGHPCLAGVDPAAVAAAVDRLAPAPVPSAPPGRPPRGATASAALTPTGGGA
ncbi:glycosyltransferase family 9 protein [Thalassiella azotivora]